MKTKSFFTLAAAVFAAVLLTSCSKGKYEIDFDHFEINYKIETNQESNECFETGYEVLFNNSVKDSGPVTIMIEGKISDSTAPVDSDIIFRTVPKFREPTPEKLDLLLKYDITISAIGKSGEVLVSDSLKETISYSEKISIVTSEEKKAALDTYTINFHVKSTVKEGKIFFVPANYSEL